MLVLSRKRDEEIVIDHPSGLITVRVMEIRGDKARIGFSAPKEVAIHRREVWDTIHAVRDISGRKEEVAREDLPAVGKAVLKEVPDEL